jgi:DNA invertase Pin-like site-specific DNA recombinase
MKDLSAIVATLEKRGASLRVLNAHIDTATANGKAFLGMLGVFAEFEPAFAMTASINRAQRADNYARIIEFVQQKRPSSGECWLK